MARVGSTVRASRTAGARRRSGRRLAAQEFSEIGRPHRQPAVARRLGRARHRGGAVLIALARVVLEAAVLLRLVFDRAVVLGDELRVVGPLLLARRRQVHHLSGGLDRFQLFLRLFGLALFVLAIELRHDLARGGFVQHADLDRLAAAAGGEGARQVHVARREHVNADADQQQHLRVYQHRDAEPESESAGGGAVPIWAGFTHGAARPASTNVALA